MISVAAASTLASQTSRGSAVLGLLLGSVLGSLGFIRSAHSTPVPTTKAGLGSRETLPKREILWSRLLPVSFVPCTVPRQKGGRHGSIICRDPARESQTGHGAGIRQTRRSR